MNTVFPLSGVTLGQQLIFHGVAQASTFPVFIAPDYKDVFSYAAERHSYCHVLAMYDEAVPNVDLFIGRLEAHARSPISKFPLVAGEGLKTLERIVELAHELKQINLGAKSLMLIIGGGTLCNAAGFLATMWSGMEMVIIPTNYTAIADVAVGSLHMVNLGDAKNRLQLYRDPLAVVLDPNFLTTLPRSERSNGLAETVKQGVAQDAALFDALEKYVLHGTIFDDSQLFDLAVRTAQLKDELMKQDPFGQRSQDILLYGHVIAHAIEPATHFSMPHGAAVSLGILGELAFFNAMASTIYQRVKAVLEGLNLPVELPSDLEVDVIVAHLENPRIPRVVAIGRLDEVDGNHAGTFGSGDVRRVLKALRR